MIPIGDNPGPRRTVPWITWGLIALNIGVFLYEVSLGQQVSDFLFAYSLVPAALLKGIPQTELIRQPIAFHTPNPVYLTLITSMFLHGGLLHIGSNMLFLFIFGDNVEDRMGHIGYLIFYLFCGVVASAAQIIVDPGSTIPNLGASGAIAGVLAAYLVLFPWAGVRTIVFLFVFITVVTVPAIVMIGLWFVLQLFNSFASFSQVNSGGVAYMAHVGGFLAGLVITFAARQWLGPPPQISYPTFPRHPQAYNQTRWW